MRSPFLAVVQCNGEEVTVPSKGRVNCTHIHGDFSYDSRCHYSCEQGYQLSSSNPLTCAASGHWSEQPPTCDCKLGGADFLDWAEVHIFLQPQHNRHALVHSGDVSDALCSNKWSHDVHTSSGSFQLSVQLCLHLWCGLHSYWFQHRALPSVWSLEFLSTILWWYVWKCLHCSSYKWSFCKKKSQVLTLFCSCVLAVQCPALQELENGLISCGDDGDREFSYGNTCTFSCATGYQLVGPTAITCTSAAVWNESAPRCAGEAAPTFSCMFFTAVLSFATKVLGFSPVLTCKNPEGEAPLISQCSHSLDKLQHGSTCSFHCEAGFELEGDSTIQCSEGGQWNKATPTCKGMEA